MRRKKEIIVRRSSKNIAHRSERVFFHRFEQSTMTDSVVEQSVEQTGEGDVEAQIDRTGKLRGLHFMRFYL